MVMHIIVQPLISIFLLYIAIIYFLKTLKKQQRSDFLIDGHIYIYTCILFTLVLANFPGPSTVLPSSFGPKLLLHM